MKCHIYNYFQTDQMRRKQLLTKMELSKRTKIKILAVYGCDYYVPQAIQSALHLHVRKHIQKAK